MNRQFPALRGLAIFLVLLNHTIVAVIDISQRFGNPAPSTTETAILFSLKEIGLFAVPIFMFMSGAFLVFAIQNRSLAQSYRIIGINLVHIVVPYLLWTAVFQILIFLILGERYTVGGYTKNFIVGYPFNFVPLLIFFYLIAPFLLRIGKRFPVQLLLVIFIYELLLYNFLFPVTLGFTYPEWAVYFRPPVIWATFATWGFFFPLGLVYNLHSKKITPVLKQMKWILIILTFLLFILVLLNEHVILIFPFADVLVAVVGAFLLPLIPRDRIPYAKRLETMGKRAYGLYLTNLITITILVYLVNRFIPGILKNNLIAVPLLFVFVLIIPQTIMHWMERYPSQTGYRYVFG